MSTSAFERDYGALQVVGRLVVLTLATTLLFFIVGVALKPMFPDGLPPGAAGRQIHQSLFVVALAVAQVIVIAVMERSDWSLTGLGSSGWSPWAILGGLGLGLAIPVSSALIGPLVGGPSFVLSWVWPTSTVLTFAFVGTLMEALLLRAYLIGLLAEVWGDVIAVAGTAMLATLLALQIDSPTPLQTFDVFMLASCLGLLRLRTGSFAAAWLAALAAVVVRDGLGTIPVPGVTAGLLAVVSFLLFRMRTPTLMSTPR